MTTVYELKPKLNTTKSELESVHKSVKMLNSRTNNLDGILSQGKKYGDLTSLGYSGTKRRVDDQPIYEEKEKLLLGVIKSRCLHPCRQHLLRHPFKRL